MKTTTVGVIGTGIMGEPMARNLLRAGLPVWVFNRTASRADRLVGEGAMRCDTPAALAAACDVIISVVSDSPDVESVYLGPKGVIEGVRRGALCIDMSTVSPETERMVADALRTKGASYLDAPVTGGKTGAEGGTLAIMVGGDSADLDRARPILEVLGKRVTHCGPIGTGQLTKLCNQIIVALNLLAVSEAVVFARKVGLNPSVMLEAVSGGAAGSWAVSNLGPRMVARDFKPMFMVDLQQKDLRITLETSARESAALLGTALVHQLLSSNQAHDEGTDGTQALVKTLERLANV